MPRRKKGGQRLLELARKRRQKAAKDKADKLAPMVIEPTLSKLRTGTTSKRKKGGQRLLDLARRRKKPAAKPASSQPSKFGARIPVGSRSPATKAQTPKAKRKTRTPAKRAADKKTLQAKQKEARKESAGMRYGSEFKVPGLSKKDREGMEESVKFGAGGGLGKIAAAGVGAGALKLYQMYKAKKAADLAAATAKAKRAAAAAKKAAEAKKGVSGIGGTRAASARARTSGLGKPKPKPKPKPKKKKSKAQTKRESMRGASAWR